MFSNHQIIEYYVLFLITLRWKKPSFDTFEIVRTLIVSTDDHISDSIFIVVMTAVSALSTAKCSWKLLFTLNSDTLSVFFFRPFLHYHFTDGSVRTYSALLWDSHPSTISDLLLGSLSLFPFKIFFTSSFLELVKIVAVCLRQNFLIQLTFLIVTCALLRLKTPGAVYFWTCSSYL